LRDIKDVPIAIDFAVPCGLILNELISNALKHAFPQNRADARIRIQMALDKNDWVCLMIEDNGVGMPEGLDWKTTESLGLRLVRILAEDQLGGNISISQKNGTHIEIRFPQKPDRDENE
jgi:two-component sensor histidine kinase